MFRRRREPSLPPSRVSNRFDLVFVRDLHAVLVRLLGVNLQTRGALHAFHDLAAVRALQHGRGRDHDPRGVPARELRGDARADARGSRGDLVDRLRRRRDVRVELVQRSRLHGVELVREDRGEREVVQLQLRGDGVRADALVGDGSLRADLRVAEVHADGCIRLRGGRDVRDVRLDAVVAAQELVRDLERLRRVHRLRADRGLEPVEESRDRGLRFHDARVRHGDLRGDVARGREVGGGRAVEVRALAREVSLERDVAGFEPADRDLVVVVQAAGQDVWRERERGGGDGRQRDERRGNVSSHS